MSNQAGRPGRVTIEVPPWVASLREPFGQAVVILGLLAVGAVVVFVLGWRGAARTPYVPLQMPWLLSGGLAGLALLGTAITSWSIHLSRRADAEQYAELREFTRDLAELCEDLRTGKRQLKTRRRR